MSLSSGVSHCPQGQCHCPKADIGVAVQSAAPGHKNDDWGHAEHTRICYGDGHRSAAKRKQTGNQSTDTGVKDEKNPGPSDA